MQEQAIAGGAERVLYVLATLAREEAPLTVAALAERTGLAQSTLYRQVALLKRWGFVLEQAGAYTPGPLCVQLARGFDQSSYLIQEALPDMTRLAADSGETVGLLVAMFHGAGAPAGPAARAGRAGRRRRRAGARPGG
ncbi:helix-turn-helix domain-containing protein, partial [Bordetella pertussis]|uniref:helix-turn-helix domain-containing protein n=1 Tax=Bordetella pertussis TaxID=520 RepID=UPI000A82158C